MIYIGIDISKYKHDCCIIKDTSEFIVENFTFLNNQKGFQSFLEFLKTYDKSLVKVALEAIGHYGINLKLYLENNNLLFMEFNPVLVKQFKDSQSLRRTKQIKLIHHNHTKINVCKIYTLSKGNWNKISIFTFKKIFVFLKAFCVESFQYKVFLKNGLNSNS